MSYGRFSEPDAGASRRLRLTDYGDRIPGRSTDGYVPGRSSAGRDDGVPPGEDAVRHVERALDRVQRRLDNLRKLVDDFGLAPLDDDRPRAA